jgi:TolA-binding protein
MHKYKEIRSWKALPVHAKEVSTMVRVLCVVMLAGSVAAMGCGQDSANPTPEKVSPEDARRDTGQAAKTATVDTQQTKEQFQKKLQTQLDELDAEIARLHQKGRDLTDEAKASWDRKMADLEPKREAARAKLDEVRHSSAEAWKDVRNGAQSAWEDLEKAFRDASHEF